MDFYMSPQLVDKDDTHFDFNLNLERLYPHEKDCLLVIVPKQHNIGNFLSKVFKHGDVQSICWALLVLALVRIAIQRAYLDEWFSIVFSTLQFFLSQGKISNRNSIESAWTNILRGFSVIAISTISAILFKSLVDAKPRQIDTVEDLISSKIDIFIPESLSSQFLGDLNAK